jgi:hypothetical protein
MEMTSAPTVDQVLADFRQGRLTEAALRAALEAGPPPKRQDLLYLQASSTSVISSILGMTQIINGEVLDPVTGDFDWPYATVLDAIRDGWRVIKFPELALLVVADRTTGLGCEFVLEKWS